MKKSTVLRWVILMFKTNYDEYYDFDKLEKEVSGHTDRWTAILEFLNGETGTLLDVGAGTAYLNRAIVGARMPLKVTNCDIRKEYVDKGRDAGFDCFTGDVRNLPFRDRSFDVVTCNEVLEHLPNMGEGLAELIRVAKKKVIITLPISRVKEDWHGWLLQAKVVLPWLVLEMERTEDNK